MVRLKKECLACELPFYISPSRKSQKFCSHKCYQYNQNLSARGIKVNTAQHFIGKTVGLLFVESLAGKGLLLCKCVCGSVRNYPTNLLSSGRIKSCGCYNRLKGRKNGQQTAWLQWLRYEKHAAKIRGIDFFLTLEEIQVICQENCFYCGVAPQPWLGAQNAYLRSCLNKKTKEPDLIFAESKVININGIDRVDASSSYVASNVVACCFQCNSAKLDYTVEEFKNWIIRCYNHQMQEKNNANS